MSGDNEGKVCYSNYQTGEVGGIYGTHTGSVESIAFSSGEELPFCVSCAIDSVINIYNIKENTVRQKITATESGGFTKLQFSQIDPSMFYASSTTGDIMIFDVRNGNKIRTYRGHAAPINDFIEVVQHKVIVTAGDDFVCNVYDLTKEPKKIEKKLEMNKELS